MLWLSVQQFSLCVLFIYSYKSYNGEQGICPGSQVCWRLHIELKLQSLTPLSPSLARWPYNFLLGWGSTLVLSGSYLLSTGLGKCSKEIKTCPWLKIKVPKITYPFHSFLSSNAHHLRRAVCSIRLPIYQWHFQILDLFIYFIVFSTSGTSKVQQIRGDFSTLCKI